MVVILMERLLFEYIGAAVGLWGFGLGYTSFYNRWTTMARDAVYWNLTW